MQKKKKRKNFNIKCRRYRRMIRFDLLTSYFYFHSFSSYSRVRMRTIQDEMSLPFHYFKKKNTEIRFLLHFTKNKQKYIDSLVLLYILVESPNAWPIFNIIQVFFLLFARFLSLFRCFNIQKTFATTSPKLMMLNLFILFWRLLLLLLLLFLRFSFFLVLFVFPFFYF